MSNCENCFVRKILQETLESERKLLQECLDAERERNRELQEKLVALSDARAYQALTYESVSDTDDYYGVGMMMR